MDSSRDIENYNDYSILDFNATNMTNDTDDLQSNFSNETIKIFSPTVDQMQFFNAFLVFKLVLFTTIFFVGTIGNTLMLIFIACSKAKSVVKVYVMNLACADACFLLHIPLWLLKNTTYEWIFGSFACQFHIVLANIGQYASSTLLCVMSIDRYLAFCRPMSSLKWRTINAARIISVVIWVSSIFIALPLSRQAELAKILDKVQCIINIENDRLNYNIYAICIYFIIPLCLTIIFSTLVIRQLRGQNQNLRSTDTGSSNRKITKLVLLIIFIYIFCWTPYWIIIFLITLEITVDQV